MSDRAAFERLAAKPAGSAESALYTLVSTLGATSTAELLHVDAVRLLGWIRTCQVPAAHAQLVLQASRTFGRRTRRGPRAAGGVDDRREKLRELLPQKLSAARMATILGVSRDTVARWRQELEADEDSAA